MDVCLQEAEHRGGETLLQWNCAFAKTHLTRCRHCVSLTTAEKLKSLHAVNQLLDGLSADHHRPTSSLEHCQALFNQQSF